MSPVRTQKGRDVDGEARLVSFLSHIACTTHNSAFIASIRKGGGFTGFWYHLGLFQGMDDFEKYDYYCYSSGCLSLVLTHMNKTVDEVFEAGQSIQTRWMGGNLSRYDMVDDFVSQLIPEEDFDRIEPFLSRLNILVTTVSDGAEASKADDYDSLVDLLIKTTWIPLVTGNGILRKGEGMYIDGGFSRTIHPRCDRAVRVPVTWNTFVHSLNPGFGRETVYELWDIGQSAAAASGPADIIG